MVWVTPLLVICYVLVLNQRTTQLTKTTTTCTTTHFSPTPTHGIEAISSQLLIGCQRERVSCQLITSDQRTFAQLTCSVTRTSEQRLLSVVSANCFMGNSEGQESRWLYSYWNCPKRLFLQKVTVNFLFSCYLGCHATFLFTKSVSVTILVTFGKKSEIMSKFNSNFSPMATVFLNRF